MEKSLPRKLRVLRAERGLSLSDAAEKMGVTRETLSDLERGKRHPYMPTLAKIAQGYGVPVEDLLEEPVAAGKVDAPEAGRAVSTFLSVSAEDMKALRAERKEEVERGIAEYKEEAERERAAHEKLEQAIRAERELDPEKEAERIRLSSAIDAVSEYLRSKAERYRREIEDENSDRFTSAIVAATWLSTLYEEFEDYDLWVFNHLDELMPTATVGDDWTWDKVRAFLGAHSALLETINRGRERLRAMKGTRDVLAERRLEKSYEKAREASERVSTLAVGE